MKIKAVVTRGIPTAIETAMLSKELTEKLLSEVIGKALGVEDPLERPAEFYVQEPDYTICCGPFGVEIRLTGVTREGRKVAQFHKALERLHALARNTLQEALDMPSVDQMRVQLFCVIMLNGDVETAAGSGVYSNVLESKAEWVEKKAA